uniref:alpha-L-fucosidase n=1 Tax=Ciona savignyi TaxID=51511 RepID=H2YWK7_CIOSA
AKLCCLQENMNLARFLCFSSIIAVSYSAYLPTWDSLDKRPLPKWYDESKIGIFIHWGVFSVPSFGEGFAAEWFWEYWKGVSSPSAVYFMSQNYPPDFQYADFAPDFTTEFFDPDQWADLFAASGAKYIVLTSKHHEGFTNWPSVNSWNWNSMDVGPHRDLVGELATAVRNRTSIHFGLYHSLYEWFHPLYLQDKANGFKTNEFVKSKTMPELYDIVNRYKPDIVWSDGQWEASSDYWNSTELIAWLYNKSPVRDTVVTNDRWGSHTLCKHGGFLTCHDHFNPGTLQTRKWENALTMDRGSWGYRRNVGVGDYISIEDLLHELISTVSCGGNMLINIGPSKEGTIHPIFEERLRQMGEWLGVNGEAVYSSQPWKHQNDSLTPGIWYTTRENAVYAFVYTWPASGNLTMESPLATSQSSSISLLGGESNLYWKTVKPSRLSVVFPVINPSTTQAKWVYVLKMIG